MQNVRTLVELLSSKDNTVACDALKGLLAFSRTANGAYVFMQRFIVLAEGENAYLRTRGLLLVIANAQWDEDCLIDESIDALLKHITDPKPIVARQFIHALPELARAKPDLREDILMALNGADTQRYALSMRPLVDKDIGEALSKLQAQANALDA